MEFNTLTRKIAEALDAEPPPAPAKSVGSTIAKKAASAGAGKQAAGAATPQAVVAFNARLASEPAIDRSLYETVTTLDALEQWISEARDVGHFAFDTETTSLDAMQADLVGFSLATRPGRACYVPVGHQASDGGLNLEQQADIDQLPLRDALRP